MRLPAIGALVLASLLAAAPPGAAQGSDRAERQAQDVFARVMSPYCPGRTLATCPSGAAQDLKQEIIRDIAAGQSPQDVEAALYAKFGDAIRGEPEATGVGLLAWVLPIVFAAGLALGLAAWLRRHVSRQPAASAAPVDASPDLAERLEEELSHI